jgi:hypothetical protein
MIILAQKHLQGLSVYDRTILHEKGVSVCSLDLIANYGFALKTF